MKADKIKQTCPDVGVILTTYNGQEYLDQQLDSLMDQVGVRVHLYVFDDQSTDATLNILERYAKANPERITLFRNPLNSGGTGLNIFNNLPLVPRGHAFYALADQDDIWLPTKLVRAAETLIEAKAGLYFSDLLAWDGKGTVFGTVRKSGPLRALDHLFAGGSAGCTYVLNAAFFRQVQDIFCATDLSGVPRLSHDWIIYFLARHHGFGVCAAPDKLIKYRIHADSQYGAMSLGGIAALRRKGAMLRNGFLREQVSNALRFAKEGSVERTILENYQRGALQRLAILLRYNFSLARSTSRFFALVAASLFFY